jgi:hypothetical protein
VRHYIALADASRCGARDYRLASARTDAHSTFDALALGEVALERAAAFVRIADARAEGGR